MRRWTAPRWKASFLSTGPIHPGIRPRYEDGIFFTGNIAGEAHPVIAEGISMAIQSSGLLAGLLIAYRGEDYARAWKRRFAPRIRAASLFAHLAMSDARPQPPVWQCSARRPAFWAWARGLSGKVPISA